MQKESEFNEYIHKNQSAAQKAYWKWNRLDRGYISRGTNANNSALKNSSSTKLLKILLSLN